MRAEAGQQPSAHGGRARCVNRAVGGSLEGHRKVYAIGDGAPDVSKRMAVCRYLSSTKMQGITRELILREVRRPVCRRGSRIARLANYDLTVARWRTSCLINRDFRLRLLWAHGCARNYRNDKKRNHLGDLHVPSVVDREYGRSASCRFDLLPDRCGPARSLPTYSSHLVTLR